MEMVEEEEEERGGGPGPIATTMDVRRRIVVVVVFVGVPIDVPILAPPRTRRIDDENDLDDRWTKTT
jgi:hypothetical protein